MAPSASNQRSPTSQYSSREPPHPWSTITAAVFLVPFTFTLTLALLLLTGSLALRRQHLVRRAKNNPNGPSPPPSAQCAQEDAHLPRRERKRDALMLDTACLDVKAQVGMPEEAGGHPYGTVEPLLFLGRRNRALGRVPQIAGEWRRCEPVDAEVMYRACEAVHRPLIVQQQQRESRPLLQLARVRVIIDENTVMSPERRTRVVEGLQVRSRAASLVDDPVGDGHKADNETCSGNSRVDSAEAGL